MIMKLHVEYPITEAIIPRIIITDPALHIIPRSNLSTIHAVGSAISRDVNPYIDSESPTREFDPLTTRKRNASRIGPAPNVQFKVDNAETKKPSFTFFFLTASRLSSAAAKP
eukprot:GHVU01060494.1.p3 GENE.GHVU01060494.1~~GHVU01060494.1.p3  ORF type:complete len:112 (+),score=9.97 GHVU01060494.1:2231-2566(+)